MVLKPGTRSMRITWPPSLLDQRMAHDLLAPVVAAFGQDLRAHAADQFERRVLIEYDDKVDRLQRRQHLGARMGLLHRSPLALQSPHGRIAVEADDEAVALGARLRQ